MGFCRISHQLFKINGKPMVFIIFDNHPAKLLCFPTILVRATVIQWKTQQFCRMIAHIAQNTWVFHYFQTASHQTTKNHAFPIVHVFRFSGTNARRGTWLRAQEWTRWIARFASVKRTILTDTCEKPWVFASFGTCYAGKNYPSGGPALLFFRRNTFDA